MVEARLSSAHPSGFILPPLYDVTTRNLMQTQHVGVCVSTSLMSQLQICITSTSQD